MEVLRQPIWPCSSFFAVKVQPLNQYPIPATKKAIKRKNRNTPEQEESEVSSKTKKPRTTETTCTTTSPIEKKPVVNAIVGWNMTNFSEREELLKMKNYLNKEVSTELTLFDESWITKKRKNMEDSVHNAAYTSRNKERLSKDASESQLNKTVVVWDPFKIKRKLTKSDLGNLCRLLVKTSLVKQHVLPYLSTEGINEIESNEGARVVVWDQDTESVHQLIYKRWSTSKSYVFIDKWNQDFVHRRDLTEGDDIGLYWDPYY